LATLSLGILLICGVILGLRFSSSGALQTFYFLSVIPPILLALVFVLDKMRSSISLLVPLVFSLLLSVLGLAIGFSGIVVHRRKREQVGKLVVSTLLAGIPVFYAIAKKLIH
jgi:ABC-type polysaccharide/polyol phosphate export permease